MIYLIWWIFGWRFFNRCIWPSTASYITSADKTRCRNTSADNHMLFNQCYSLQHSCFGKVRGFLVCLGFFCFTFESTSNGKESGFPFIVPVCVGEAAVCGWSSLFPIHTYGHEPWVVTDKMRSHIHMVEIRFLRRVSELLQTRNRHWHWLRWFGR